MFDPDFLVFHDSMMFVETIAEHTLIVLGVGLRDLDEGIIKWGKVSVWRHHFFYSI